MDLVKWKIKYYYSLLRMRVLRLRSKLLLKRYPFLRWSTERYGYTNYDELPWHIRKRSGRKVLKDLKQQYKALPAEERCTFHVNFLIDGDEYCIFRW